jgi:hypothetical protein
VLSDALMEEIATAKLEMVGLKPEDGDKFPSELSGGMTKRVALARGRPSLHRKFPFPAQVLRWHVICLLFGSLAIDGIIECAVAFGPQRPQ